MQVSIAVRQPLWIDEISSLATATGHSLEHPAAVARPELGDFVEGDRPLPAREWRKYLEHGESIYSDHVIRALLLSDVHPPLYFVLLNLWTRIWGTGDLALRSLSILFSLACLPIMASLARRLGGENAILPACLLFAFSPLTIYYSTEGRMYSLLLLLVIATATISVILTQEGGNRGRYGLWIAISAAGFLTHYFFFFPWAAFAIFLLLRPDRLARGKLIVCVLLLAFAILPWYVLAFLYRHHWQVSQGWLSSRPLGFSQLSATRAQLLQAFYPTGFHLWQSATWFARASLLLFVSLALWAALRLRQAAFRDVRLSVWLWFAFSCAAPTVVSNVGHNYVSNYARYALTALPAAYLLAAIALANLSRSIRFGFLALIVACWSASIVKIYQLNARNEEQLNKIAEMIADHRTARDVVIVDSIPSGILGIARYAGEDTLIAAWVPQLETKRIPGSITKISAGSKRALLVQFWAGQPAPELDWLRANATLVRREEIGAAEIADFRLSN